jgi:phenylacetate-CoA ligase
MPETSLTRLLYDASPVWFQNLMATAYGWEKNRYRYGDAEAQEWLEFYRESATWSEAQLRAYQLEQLQALLGYAWEHVPYYRSRFDAAQLTPASIQSVQDMQLLPVLTKDDIRGAGTRLISDQYDPATLQRAPTSGSTGMPITIYSDRHAARRNFVYRWAQCRPGLERNRDPYACFTGLEVVDANCQKPPFWRMNHASKQRIYSVFHLSDKNMPYYLEDLERFGATWFYGYPSALFTLANFLLRTGRRFANPPKAVITSSEQCLPEYREAIEKAFQTRVWDEYGQVEMGGVAFTCACGKLHEKLDYSLMEFIPVRKEEGLHVCELICTSFVNQAMPLIRYRVGDLAVIDPNATCPHGTPGRVIEQIYGRTAHSIICADGSHISNISVMAKKCRNVKAMQAVQEEAGAVFLRVVPQPEFDRQQDEPLILREFRKKLGDESRMRIAIQYVDRIELTKSGKFLSIVNRMSKPENH